MEFHRGRLIDDLLICAQRISEASKRFYRAALGAIRGDLAVQEGPGHFFATNYGWMRPVKRRFASPCRFSRRRTARREPVLPRCARHRRHGECGAPGERSYHPGYYAAYCSILTATTSKSSTARPRVRRIPLSLRPANAYSTRGSGWVVPAGWSSVRRQVVRLRTSAPFSRPAST